MLLAPLSGLVLCATWVDATTLRLRAEPNTQAAIIAELPIGTPCEDPVTPDAGAPEGWVKVTCYERGTWNASCPAADGGSECTAREGFTKRELLSAKEPKYSTYWNAFHDETKPLAERLNLAGRAMAFAIQWHSNRDREDVAEIYTKLFVDLEHQKLLAAREKGKKKVVETVRFKTEGPSGANVAFSGKYHWFRFESYPGDDFVFALLEPDGTLRVRSGHSTFGEYQQDPGQSEGHRTQTLSVESSYTFTPDYLFEQVLAHGIGNSSTVGCIAGMTAGGQYCADPACDVCLKQCLSSCFASKNTSSSAAERCVKSCPGRADFVYH
jgi:hypothetical protein